MLSLLALKNIITNDKKGYSITPTVNSLKDLKALLNNMYTVRTASGSYCSGHNGTSYGGKISLKEMNSALNNLKACNCNGRTVNTTTCDCNSRSACSCNGRTYYSCSCNGRTGGCNCNNYVSGCSSVCTCNSRTNPVCDCQVRTNSCTCNTYYPPGTCDGYAYCTCNLDNGTKHTCISYGAQWITVSACNCDGRTNENGVYGTTPASGCTTQTTSSDCTSYTASSDCTSYVGALCPSRTTCTCNTVNEFS